MPGSKIKNKEIQLIRKTKNTKKRIKVVIKFNSERKMLKVMFL